MSSTTVLDCRWPGSPLELPAEAMQQQAPVPPAKRDKHGLATQLPALLAAAAQALARGHQLLVCDDTGALALHAALRVVNLSAQEVRLWW